MLADSDGFEEDNVNEGLIGYKIADYSGCHTYLSIYDWDVTRNPEARSSLGPSFDITVTINDRPGAVTFTCIKQVRFRDLSNYQANNESFFKFLINMAILGVLKMTEVRAFGVTVTKITNFGMMSTLLILKVF